MREIRILKELKHENIVSLIEVFRWKGKIFLVFEYVPHTILEELENNSNGLDPQEVKKYMWQLIRGTEFVHSHNVIHRDIKPENLLISKHGALKICDFGFARFLSGPDSLYTDYVSTRWYRAPELLVGDANYGKGIDIWAIGCMFAELSAGQPLFPGESDLRTLQYVLNIVGGRLTEKQRNVLASNPIFEGMDAAKACCSSNSPSALSQKFPQLPPAALAFLRSCLSIDPAERPTCTQLIQHEYFAGSLDKFALELKEIAERDETEFQMRTRAMQQANSEPSPPAAVGATTGATSQSQPAAVGGETAAQSRLKSIGEDKDESSDSDMSPAEDYYRLPNEPAARGMPLGKSVNKVTITFNKPKHMAEHSGSSNELNVSFSKKSTKVPPGGGAGPSTMILKDLSNPLRLTTSKRSFKEADFQNPPSFLKGEILAGKHAGESKYGLPQLRGKNIQPAGPRVNRLVALPQITESKGSGEKLYLRNPGKQDGQMDSSFEYKPYAQSPLGLNDSGDENVNPSLFATSLHANRMGKHGGEAKSSLFPSIPNVVHQNQNVRIIILIRRDRGRRYSIRSPM